ncbi:MAG TPA: hypothetical protein ENM98_00495 [Halothiobacillaceae bacterium]|nr:hypothetical protein [Halothiobacillaceae bacterium]
MDPTIAGYIVLLALTLGLSGALRAEREHCGRGLLLVIALAGFLVVASLATLLTAGSGTIMIIAAIATFFAAQSATTGFLLLRQEIHAEQHADQAMPETNQNTPARTTQQPNQKQGE